MKSPCSALQFRASGSDDWSMLEPVITGDEGKDEQSKGVAASNNAKLHSYLLSSLQMQHLVVLAGSGCSLSVGGPSMWHLWNKAVGEEPSDETKEIAKIVGHGLDDPNIEALLSRAEAYLQLYSHIGVSEFLNKSKRVILGMCSEFLNEDRLEAHQTFLHRLSRRRSRDQRLKVFTTNYDLCFERAAGNIGNVALDGFSFTAPRTYNPRYFGYDIVRRSRYRDDVDHLLEGVFYLYKLHGSVNWARKANGEIKETEDREPSEACLIYPARGKYQQSYSQPYLESMAQYLAAIREPNTCIVVVGFGFNDDHLSEPLISAISSNPHLRVIVVDPCSEEKVNEASEPNPYWKELARLSQRGEDIWLVGARFEQFAQMIPDLKALTPAENLVKAIKGLSKNYDE